MKILCQNKANKQKTKPNKQKQANGNYTATSKYNCICSTGCEELWQK